MAYARWGPDSDVYVYSDGERWLCHCSGPMSDMVVCHDRAEMVMHLQQHKVDGHRVPQDAIDRLMQEIAADDQ